MKVKGVSKTLGDGLKMEMIAHGSCMKRKKTKTMLYYVCPEFATGQRQREIKL
jgi:hypothetical protein